jgi:hypothetical protein
MYKKLTPVLAVESIEPVLPLWESLGFARTVEAPHADRLGFVALQSGSVEVMYQTYDSIRADEARIMEGKGLGRAALFIEVEKLESVASRVPSQTDVVVKQRKTFYGSTEMIIRDAAGNVIIFAEMSA